MPEDCPAPAALAGFAQGRLGQEEAQSVEVHLDKCLACAKALDQLTRAQLEELGAQSLSASRPAFSSSHVEQLVKQAREHAFEPRPNESGLSNADSVISVLDPPSGPAMRGKFAGYEILKVAGSGGMGVVLQAHDPTLHRIVAIKVLAPNRAWDEASAERFLREARTIAAIQHEHVVTVHAAGREKGLPYLVMPFYASGTLEDWLEHTPQLPAPIVIRIGIQLARALEVTHAQGVLHRDIKPSNVLLEDNLERVRLADFGLAQPLQEAGNETSRRAMIAGTPQYMSPEQARGEPIDARSDVFGLGALLFHLATGRTIHAEAAASTALAAATQERPMPVRKANPELPAGLANVIDRMLAARPEERFDSAKNVAAVLTALVAPPNRVLVWLRRAALLMLAAALAVLALDWSGRTAVVNSLLCAESGNGYFVRGRFGTFANLADAVARCRGGEIIEARFSGERPTPGIRVGVNGLTIRAAAGFTPALLATNYTGPMILVDAPLHLEGLSLWRRANGFNFAPLLSVENAPLHLLNCRVGRIPQVGEAVLVRSGQRVVTEEPPRQHRPLMVVSSGGSVSMRNTLVLGAHASGLSFRSITPQPLKVEVENSLFVVQRSFVIRESVGTDITLKAARSVFATGALIDLEDGESISKLETSWSDCLFGHKQGALLQLNRLLPTERFRNVSWLETNVVYHGPGTFVADRRGRKLNSESEWSKRMQLPEGVHRLSTRELFSMTRVRSSPRLSATDVELENPTPVASESTFNAAWIGEGAPWAAFRRAPSYRRWEELVRASGQQWAERRVNPAAAR